MKEENKTEIHTAFMIIVLSCILLFVALFWSNIPQICVSYNEQESTLCTNNYSSIDSTSYASLTTMVDSIKTVMNRIDSQYQQNIDTMINKMNTWMGFWMTILTFILMIVSIWQFLNVKNIRDDFKEMIGISEEKMKDYDNKMKNYQTQMKEMSDIRNYYASVILLLSSIRAINSLADSRLNDKSNISVIKYCMENLTKSLSYIEDFINKECKCNNSSHIDKGIEQDVIKSLPLVLVNVRETLFLVKAFSANIVDNIEFDLLQQDLAVFEKKIRPHNVISESDKEELYILISRISNLTDSL